MPTRHETRKKKLLVIATSVSTVAKLRQKKLVFILDTQLDYNL